MQTKLIIIEPWVEWYFVKENETIKIVCTSISKGGLEIVHRNDGLTFFAWDNCFIDVFKDGLKMTPAPQN
jgi:hypothetical protein